MGKGDYMVDLHCLFHLGERHIGFILILFFTWFTLPCLRLVLVPKSIMAMVLCDVVVCDVFIAKMCRSDFLNGIYFTSRS